MLETQFDPFPLLYTERLCLRRFELEDAPVLFEMRQNEQVMAYFDRPRMKSVEEAVALINNILSQLEKNESIAWVISLKDQPAVKIGNISFWRIQKEHYRAEIGYMLQPAHWNKGIMKEAAAAVIKYAFETMQLHSIEANTNPHNKASQHLLERLGFVQEAYFKENYFYDGKFYDSVIYSLLNK